jgi:hypothetical protein
MGVQTTKRVVGKGGPPEPDAQAPPPTLPAEATPATEVLTVTLPAEIVAEIRSWAELCERSIDDEVRVRLERGRR